MSLQTDAVEIGISVVVIAAACSVTWFAADAHYSKQLASFKGQIEGAAAAQKAAVTAQIKIDQDAAKEVDDATKQQIGSMAETISDLSLRLQHAASSGTRTVRPAPAGPAVACVKPDRSAAAAGGGPVREPEKPVAAAGSEPENAAISADILDGVLTVGIDALKAELLWRQYVRQTGQTK